MLTPKSQAKLTLIAVEFLWKKDHWSEGWILYTDVWWACIGDVMKKLCVGTETKRLEITHWTVQINVKERNHIPFLFWVPHINQSTKNQSLSMVLKFRNSWWTWDNINVILWLLNSEDKWVYRKRIFRGGCDRHTLYGSFSSDCSTEECCIELCTNVG